MHIVKSIISFLSRLLWQKRAPLARNKPQELPEDVLEKVRHEAQFLRGEHEVIVRELAPDELPCVPKRAE